MKNFFHLFRIVRVFARYGLEEFIFPLQLFRGHKFVFRLFFKGAHKDLPRGERLRLALQELGPIFVKFGQVLSTRPDLLPDDLVQSLVKLQDQVPPFSGDQAVEIIEAAYGDSLDNHFCYFEKETTASASIAQVHYAELHDGTEVVVKVIRPDILPIIEQDLDLLRVIADLVHRYWSEGVRVKPRELVQDYDKTIHNELDMMREGANASQLRTNFENSDKIYVPRVFWEHSNHDVLVMERIYGTPIRNIKTLKEQGLDMRQLAHDGVDIFFTQAFRDGFFHADMHPGNIFVSETGQYRAIDFGIMGTLSNVDKRYLAENLLAFFNRDYHRVADAHIRAGWVPPDTNAEEFEGAIRTVCEPIFSRPINEISFGGFLIDLFRVARQFNMPIQPQLVLLQKTILNIEGLGRQLYPQLDLWETAKPFLEKWMNEQIGPKAAIKTIRRELPNLFTLVPEIPALTHQIMYQLKNDKGIIKTQDIEIRKLHEKMDRQNRKAQCTIFAIFCLLGAFLLFPKLGQQIVFSHEIAIGLLLTGFIILLRPLLDIFRKDKGI